MLGLTPERNLFHVFHEGVSLRDILYPTDYGFSILPASSGVSEMLSLSTGQKLELLEAMDVLEDEIDYLIVDTGAGINDSVLYFNLAARTPAGGNAGPPSRTPRLISTEKSGGMDRFHTDQQSRKRTRGQIFSSNCTTPAIIF